MPSRRLFDLHVKLFRGEDDERRRRFRAAMQAALQARVNRHPAKDAARICVAELPGTQIGAALIATQNAMFDVIETEEIFADAIGGFAEEFLLFANAGFDAIFHHAVEREKIVEVEPERKLFLPVSEKRRIQVLQKGGGGAILLQFIRFFQLAVIDRICLGIREFFD